MENKWLIVSLLDFKENVKIVEIDWRNIYFYSLFVDIALFSFEWEN